MPASTLHRVLARHGVSRLADLERRTGRIVRRIETARPGELVHVDIKKQARIPDGGGWKVNGRAKRVDPRRAGRPKLGYAFIHSAIDAHSRLAYSEIHPDERGLTAVGFWRRAVAFFASYGITIERVITDNGACYRADAFRAALFQAGITHTKTRYASVGDAQVAYQVVGEGPTDLLYCYGLGGHVDAFWELGDIRRLFGALGSFSRVILFDRRGTGVSDALPAGAFPTWEELAEDQAAVLEAVGSERTALLANLDSGPMAILFAAMHPEAVTALVPVNTSARYSQADDYPIGEPAEAVDALVDVLESTWGTPELAALSNPDRADDPEYLRIAARLLRASATPRAAASQYRYMLRNLDVREALGLVQAPTLVLHSQTSPFIPLAHGRYLAEHIAGARLVEVPGGNLAYMTDDTIAVITDFLTGDIADLDIDRLLTTVLFTDIVDSTSRASSMGDHRWRALLDAHDEAVRELLRRFRGREVNTTGDGFVASFDGPARAIRCARAIRSATTRLGLQLRVGMHTGECEVRGDDLGGLAVHIAARVAKLAGPDHILVSRTVVDLVAGSGIEFDDRGEHELKGVPGLWRLHSVKS